MLMFLQLWEETGEEEDVDNMERTESKRDRRERAKIRDRRDHRPSLAEADAEYERLCQARKAQVKLDQGHLGMSDPLRLDFYPSTPHKTHQTHRPTRPTGPQPDPGPTSSTGPLDQRAHHTKGPIHQGQQHLDPW